MGMYNEVFVKCPTCNCHAYCQISQIVLGFGGFYLDRPDTLEALSTDELTRLREAISGEYFCCRSDKCGPFIPYPADGLSMDEKHALIHKLFNIE